MYDADEVHAEYEERKEQDSFELSVKNCIDCTWFETFNPRDDEPSNMGCTHADWAGYILNPESPMCDGWGFKDARRKIFKTGRL